MDEADRPLLIAGRDRLLLRVDHPDADRCRAELARFAELERSPEHVHTYVLNDLGLWNAKSSGVGANDAIDTLARFCAGPVPHATADLISESMERFGSVRIETAEDPATGLLLRTVDEDLLDELTAAADVAPLLGPRLSATTAQVVADDRGRLKQALIAIRRPADDLAGLNPGAPYAIGLRPELELRPYQRDAVASWLPSGTGVVVLPCGAGKTVTAIAAAAEVGANTLILVTGQQALAQWRDELARFTTVPSADVGRFPSRSGGLRPITLATYQAMSRRKDGRFANLEAMAAGDWGLVVYDEVHLLPSAVFRLTAGIQARRRLGLTATLVREDGREADVFALIGPKRFDVPWSDLELQGWIAPVACTEIRVVPDADERMAHAKASARLKASVAAGVGAKAEVVEALLRRHADEPILIIGTYLDGLRALADRFRLPLVTGETSTEDRIILFDDLRSGRVPALVVSKVANFSLDLPEVSVAIQVSGTFGSRQEEAQRLGRIVRPKPDGRSATFYTVVARDTVEQDFSTRRQRFLAEQGYHYEIVDGTRLVTDSD